MIIDIILPFKEEFSNAKASAVSLTIKNSAEFSDFKSNINVFGQITKQPFQDLNFTGIKTNKLLHFGHNRSIFVNYLKKTNLKLKAKRIIEMHNRPYVFNYALKKINNIPITLHFHNDPRTMKGSKSVKQRIKIASKAAAVYFVSEYIRNCFLDGIKQTFNNLHIIPNGIQRTLTEQPVKQKEVIFVGRLVKEKGCHLFVKSIRNIVKKHPDWKFKIIGTPKAGQDRLDSEYAKNLIDEFSSLGKNTEYLGFVSNVNVKKILEKTSILIVPSIWQEPFALTALEGMCNGVAVIASKVGGMGEMLEDIGLLIDNIDELKLEQSIKKLIENKHLLKEFQNKSWTKYHFNQSEIVKKQDSLRNQIFTNYNYNKSG